MDEGVLGRAYRVSFVLLAVIGVFGSAYGGYLWGFVFILAGAWSIVNIWVLDHLLTGVLLKRSHFRSFVIFFLKVPVLYGLFWAYLVYVPWKASALIAGVALPFGVIVLKALGNSLNETLGVEEATQGQGKDNKAQSSASENGPAHNSARTR